MHDVDVRERIDSERKDGRDSSTNDTDRWDQQDVEYDVCTRGDPFDDRTIPCATEVVDRLCRDAGNAFEEDEQTESLHDRNGSGILGTEDEKHGWFRDQNQPDCGGDI